jgi:hypothetical protein
MTRPNTSGSTSYKLIPTPPALEDSKNRNRGSEVLLKLSTRLCLFSVGTEPIGRTDVSVKYRMLWALCGVCAVNFSIQFIHQRDSLAAD